MAKYELIITDTNSQVSILAKGDQGPQGEIGPQGPQGTAGSGANNLADLGDVDSTSTSGQALTSDGDGTFSFTTIGGVSETLDSVTGRGNTTNNSISVGGVTATSLNTHNIPSGTGTLALTTSTVSSAGQLSTARTISLGGDVTGSASFDGTADITITAAVADDSHDHTIANVDGLQTALDGKLSASALSDTDDLSEGTTNLYYTDARSRGAISLTGGGSELSYNNSTGVFSYTSPTTVAETDAVTIQVRNTTGSTIAKGVPVYISGHSGTAILVAPADANDATKMPAIGLMSGALSNNDSGTVTSIGLITGIDLSGFSEGDILYVDTTPGGTTFGGLTNSPPTGETSKIQNLGKVARAVNNGEFVISGPGRSNATPNLDDGDIFIGNGSNQAVTSSLSTEVRGRVSAIGDLSYNNSTGVFSFTERTDAEVQGLITGGTGVSVTSGEVAIGQPVGTADTVAFNTVTAAVDLNGAALTLDVDADTTITAGTDDQIDIAFGGNDRIQLSTGVIDLKNDGSQSEVRLYCESANAHYAALQAPAHADFSANVTATLPSDSGTLALTKILPSAHTSAHTLVAADSGKHISITTGGVTVNTDVFEVGDAVSIYNNSGSNQTITQGTGATLRTAGTATTGSITLAQYGICTILCVVDSAGADEFVVSGGGIS